MRHGICGRKSRAAAPAHWDGAMAALLAAALLATPSGVVAMGRPAAIRIAALGGQAANSTGAVAAALARAQAELKAHHWAQAAQLLAGLRGDSVTQAAAILHLHGLVAQGQGQTQAAAEYLQRAFELAPEGPNYAAVAGLAMLRANAAETASRDLETATRIAPEDAALWRALALANLRMGRNQAAAEATQHAIALSPAANVGPLYLLLAQALGNDGEMQPAIQAAERALSSDPSLPNAHLALGILLAQQSPPDFERAAGALRRAEALAPSFAPAFLQLGQLLLRQGQPRQALPQLERARSLEPRLDEALYLLAQAHARLGETAQAAKLMRAYEQARRKEREQLANQLVPTFVVH